MDRCFFRGCSIRISCLSLPILKSLYLAPLFFSPGWTKIGSAARLMAAEKIGCMSLMDDGRLVGLVTTAGILRYVKDCTKASFPGRSSFNETGYAFSFAGVPYDRWPSRRPTRGRPAQHFCHRRPRGLAPVSRPPATAPFTTICPFARWRSRSQNFLSPLYERGCQEKTPHRRPPTGRKPIVAASPVSVVTNDFNQLCEHSVPHPNVMSSSETEKRSGTYGCRPRLYLSLNGLLLFQVVRGGIELLLGLRLTPTSFVEVGGAKTVDPPTIRILTLDLIRSEHTDDEVSN